MNDELAKRAVACPGWRWMPGMRHIVDASDDLNTDAWAGSRVMGYGDATGFDGDFFPEDAVEDSRGIPDLDDPATLGCFLALVREVWGDPTACLYGEEVDAWHVVCDGYDPEPYYLPSEAEALVAALEAAPR